MNSIGKDLKCNITLSSMYVFLTAQIPTTDVIVEDHLGEGAFGFVFKGVVRGPLRNPKLSSKLKQTIGLPVAIKLLKGTSISVSKLT